MRCDRCDCVNSCLLLSNPDHPLSRLLGELQMEIFTLLKPVQSAREKAGDFPQLYISCKEAEPESEWVGQHAEIICLY